MIRSFLFLLLCMTLTLPIWGQQTLDISPIQDNTLYENASGNVSNGAGIHLFAGLTDQGSNRIRRALVAFDVAGNLPANATVTGVSLSMTVNRTIVGPFTMGLHRVTQNWGKGLLMLPVRKEPELRQQQEMLPGFTAFPLIALGTAQAGTL